MENLMNLRLNVAVAGFVPDGADREKLIRKIDSLFVEIQIRAADYNSGEYGFSGEEIHISLLAGALSADPIWSEFLDDSGMSLHAVSLSEEEDNEQNEILKKADTVSVIQTGRFHDAENKTVAANWLSDQADLMILLWNESTDCGQNAAWELLQMGRQKKIPCIWISTGQQNKVYWSEDSYFEVYSSERLKHYFSSLLGEKVEPVSAKTGNLPFISFGDHLYSRFMQKYKAQMKPAPYVVDEMLGSEFCFQNSGEETELARKELVKHFNVFDHAAIEFAQKYRVSIYLRSILPFMATVFLAIGFYLETVMGFCVKATFGSMNIWSLLAGIGFLIHALINLYAYCLSNHETVNHWHWGFINDRFIAETLRILIHFTPFGIPVNVRNVMNRCSSRLSKDGRLYPVIRKIMRNYDITATRSDQTSTHELLHNVSLLIDDQIIYHRNTAARYQSIIKKLKKYSFCFFQAGFVFVLFRGVLQFAIVYIPIEGANNGISAMSFIRSFANMLALFLPAWASYFSTKLSLCDFNELMDNNKEMAGELEKMKKLVTDLLQRDNIPFEMLCSLADELSVLLLSEVTNWYGQLSLKQVTKL